MVKKEESIARQPFPWPFKSLRPWEGLLRFPLPCLVSFGLFDWCSRFNAALPPFVFIAMADQRL